MTTESQIRQAMEKLPQLTIFGVGLYKRGAGLTPNERLCKFRKQQKELLASTKSFQKACQWLGYIEKIKLINNRYTSYGLKHIAEKEIGYIANGVFIAAAIHCGFDFKVVDGGPNVQFNMSEKSISLRRQGCRKQQR